MEACERLAREKKREESAERHVEEWRLSYSGIRSMLFKLDEVFPKNVEWSVHKPSSHDEIHRSYKRARLLLYPDRIQRVLPSVLEAEIARHAFIAITESYGKYMLRRDRK